MRTKEPYGKTPITQTFRIEIESYPGNFRLTVQDVARLIRRHEAPLLSCVVHDLSPQPIKVGERVHDTLSRFAGDEGGIVLAIDDDDAWVHWNRPHGARSVHRLSSLSRA